jgi:hypothetical protein
MNRRQRGKANLAPARAIENGKQTCPAALTPAAVACVNRVAAEQFVDARPVQK